MTKDFLVYDNQKGLAVFFVPVFLLYDSKTEFLNAFTSFEQELDFWKNGKNIKEKVFMGQENNQLYLEYDFTANPQ